MSLLEQQHQDEERLRRLALRPAGVGDVEVPGFVGAHARKLYGGFMDDAPATTWVYSDGAKFFDLSYTRARADEVMDGPFYVGCKVDFRYPQYLNVSVALLGFGGFTLWSGAGAPSEDLGEGGEMLGTGISGENGIATMFWVGDGSDGQEPDPYASSGPSDHFGGAPGGYPRFRRFYTDVSGFAGQDPSGTWRLTVEPISGPIDDLVTTLGIDPPQITLERWAVSFAEDFGEHLTPGTSGGDVHLGEMLASSDGFTLAPDRRGIVIPAGAGGLYRAVGSAELRAIGDQSSGAFPRASVRVLGPGELGAFPVDPSGLGVGTAEAPGDGGDPYNLTRAQASALLQVPDEGGTVALGISPGGEVDSFEAPTGNVTDVHVTNAHLGVYRWFA